MKKLFSGYGLYLAWLVSLIAVLGSLYWSYFLEVEACTLCWYQRICLFPLALILGIAAYRHDHHVLIYALSLSLCGAALALYHILIQRIPSLVSPSLCTTGAACHKSQFSYFGLTPPMLSFAAFLLIVSFLLSARSRINAGL